MRENYDKAFNITIGLEGGYVNDPKDPGGETKYGLSKKWNPTLDIKNLTMEQAKDIYLTRNWISTGCDKLSYPMDIIAFDRSVLYGVPTAITWVKISKDWKDLLFLSLQHNNEHWNAAEEHGWNNRIINLWRQFD